MSCVSVALALFPVADPDLQIRGGGGGGAQKHFFRLFRPQSGLKIRGARASGPLP